jgi:hypothetical protein
MPPIGRELHAIDADGERAHQPDLDPHHRIVLPARTAIRAKERRGKV